MSDNNSTDHQGRATEAAALAGARRRTPWPLLVVAVLIVIVPFTFWYGTWFGRTLKDEEIEKYLQEETSARHVQHALAQLAGRMEAGDERVKRWYPSLVALAGHKEPDVRMTLAWAMGQDNRAEEFRAPLQQLLRDPEPIVRRNAALALVRFGDATGRPELLAMLRPFVVTSPTSGTLTSILPAGAALKRGSLLARVRDDDGSEQEIRTLLPGKIEKVSAAAGSQIEKGSELLILAPDSQSVWEALRALVLVGARDDLPEVERYAQGAAAGMSEEIKKQAAKTAAAIRARMKAEG